MKLTQRVDIENWLNTHHHMPENYTIDENLVVSITGDVSFENHGLSEFPFAIDRIEGNFNCSHNQLETLVGGPQIVTKKYNCSHNHLSDMNGMAKQVSHINCSNNQIRSLCDFPDVSGITAVNNLYEQELSQLIEKIQIHKKLQHLPNQSEQRKNKI